MNIVLRQQSKEPLYKQIYRQIVMQIADGGLAVDEMLPSVRSAARYLGVAVVTVKTAYEELEKDGFIYTLPAKGCFVAPGAKRLSEKNLLLAEEACETFLVAARACGLSQEDVIAMIRQKTEE